MAHMEKKISESDTTFKELQETFIRAKEIQNMTDAKFKETKIILEDERRTFSKWELRLLSKLKLTKVDLQKREKK